MTYGLSEIGDWLTTIALAVLVYDATGSAVATTVLFICSKFLPAFAAPVITARVERIAPRRTLPVLYVVEALAFGGMALAAGTIAIVVALAAIAGGGALVGRALVRAAVASAMPDPDDLRKANGALNVVFSVTFAIGPAVAGGAVAAFGPAATLLGGAVLLVSMAAYAGRAPLPELAEEDVGDELGCWAKLAESIRHLRDEPIVSRMFAIQAVLLALFTMIPPIEVVYARHDLGTSAAGFGALMAAWGVGAVAGSAMFARLARTTVAVALLAGAAVGASYLGMGLVGSLGGACALSALGGVGNGMQWVAFVTAVQERVPAALQARAMALVEALGAAVPGLGFAAGGAIAALSSARTAYVLAGGAILVVSAAAGVAGRSRRAPAAEPVSAHAAVSTA